MKHTAVLCCILLAAACLFPAMVAGQTTNESDRIIGGLTLEPTIPEPTRPSPEPTTIATTETPALQVGWLTIVSSPSGAEVFIDGQSRGFTPLDGIEVGTGAHPVRITMEGFEPYMSTARVGSGDRAIVDATLNPVPAPAPTTEPTIIIGPIGADKGWFRIHSNVDGARATLDNGAAGECTVAQGSCSIVVATTGTPVSSYSVTKTGYQPYSNQVTRMPAKGETVDLYATLNPYPPTPAYGSIRVMTSPSNAVAYLDGLSWQYTPCTFSALTAGTNHNIQVSLSGYQTYTTTVTVPADQTAYVNVNLVPVYPQSGSLNIVTTPSGADIYIDGRYISQSPGIVPGLSPGNHNVRLHKAGYDEYVATMAISAGRQVPLTVTLTPQSSKLGSIEVASSPAGAALYLDGNYLGNTPIQDYFDITSLTPGIHTILLRLADYQDYSKPVSVPAGGTVTVNANLVAVIPGPAPDKTGQIIIASAPSGAEVLLDNVYKGITPVTLQDIPAGSHILTLKLRGYQDSVQTVTVAGGQSAPVAVTLLEAVAAPTRSPLTAIPVLAAVLIIGLIRIVRRK